MGTNFSIVSTGNLFMMNAKINPTIPTIAAFINPIKIYMFATLLFDKIRILTDNKRFI